MQFNNLKRKHPNKKSRLVGRGGTRGKTTGRGTKGQNARAGHKKRPEIRDFIKRIPKLRGRGKNINTSIKAKPFIVNIGDISKVFKNGDVVTREALIKAGILSKTKGGIPSVKLLGSGILDKKLTIKGCLISNTARQSVEKAGGTIEL